MKGGETRRKEEEKGGGSRRRKREKEEKEEEKGRRRRERKRREKRGGGGGSSTPSLYALHSTPPGIHLLLLHVPGYTTARPRAAALSVTGLLLCPSPGGDSLGSRRRNSLGREENRDLCAGSCEEGRGLCAELSRMFRRRERDDWIDIG